ncbi:MAG: non-homologous end-joining DNA ligase [Acidimicrobiales bacterium]
MKLAVAGRQVPISTPDRILWPATGMTKSDLITYYLQVAAELLPHLRSHPVTLRRFPDGVEGPQFFQTRAPSHPSWVRHVDLRSPNDKALSLVVLDDLASLVWAANISAIELHPYLGTADDFDHPSQVVFDLDPGRPAGLVACCTVAAELRALLDDLHLRSFPKSSGGKGLHVHVPVDHADFASSKAFSRAIAEMARERLPMLVTTSMRKEERAGKVFIDWGQNDPWRSTIAPYSARGFSLPTVAWPLRWDEVERVAATGDPSGLLVLISHVTERLDAGGDPWPGFFDVGQSLPVP